MGVDLTQYPAILDVYIKRAKAKMPMHGFVSNKYGPGFAAKFSGETAKVQLEPKYIVTDGFEFDPQTIKVETADVVVDQEKTVAVNLSAVDMTLTFDTNSEMERAFKAPAVDRIAAAVENNLNDEYVNISQYVGTAGTLPSTFATFYAPIKELTRLGYSESELSMFLGVDETATILDYLDDRTAEDIARQAIREGFVGRFGGVPVHRNLFRKIHTAGTEDGNSVVNGANQGGNGDLIIQSGSGTFLAGDIITAAGCNAWNYATNQTIGALKTHVVDTNSAGGSVTLSLAENLIPSSTNAFRNVSAFPTDAGAIVLKATHKVNLVLAPRAFASAIVPLATMKSAPMRVTRTHDGISMTMSTGYSHQQETEGTKVMALFGASTVDRTAAIRLAG